MRFNGRKENLHSFWDTALVELEQGTPSEIAGRIQSAMTSEIVSNGSRNSGTVRAGIAGDSKDASLSVTCVGRRSIQLTANGRVR